MVGSDRSEERKRNQRSRRSLSTHKVKRKSERRGTIIPILEKKKDGTTQHLAPRRRRRRRLSSSFGLSPTRCSDGNVSFRTHKRVFCVLVGFVRYF